MGASRPKGNRPTAGGQVHGRFALERKTGLRPVGRYTGASRSKGKPACGRWAGTRALRARKLNRPTAGGLVHRPAAGGQVHGRFAPEKKPAFGRWAGTRALRSRKETGLRPVGR